jgi:hypothetical protein
MFPLLYSRAKDLLKAKQSLAYPSSRRARSEDKRVHFFAKACAGLGLGIAPATAIKRLSNLRLPDSRTLKRESYEYEFPKHAQKGQRK